MNAMNQEIIEAPAAAPLAPMSETAALISMIERAARDPTVDIDKFERLMTMRVKAEERASRMAYSSALSAMQPKLPQVDRNGRIKIAMKADREKPESEQRLQQSTPYALWEDINTAIGPHLAEHGFALSFRTGRLPEGLITVTAILSHREGHQEETTMVLTHDSTGSKNAVQAIGSSISYGKRYTAGLLLNITSRAPGDADDDGKKAGGPALIDSDQFGELRKLMADNRVNEVKFLAAFKIEGLGDLLAARFDEAKGSINALIAKRAAAGVPK